MVIALGDINANELGGVFRLTINANSRILETAINAKAENSALSNHIGIGNIHRVCNDNSSPSGAILWSSSKINTLLQSHTHAASQVIDGLDVFAPKFHQHELTDIVGITGIMNTLTGKTISQTNNADDEEDSRVDMTFSFTPNTNIPPILNYSILATFSSPNEEYEVYCSFTGNYVAIRKPPSSWAGWNDGEVNLTVVGSVTNPFNNSSLNITIPPSGIGSKIIVAKYNYSKLTYEGLISIMKSQTGADGFMTVLANILQ